MNRKTVLSTVCAASVLGAALAAAHGFVLINPPRKWFQGISGGANDLPVAFLVNSAGEESVGDADNGVTAVRNALEEWENEVSSNLFATGTTPSNAIGLDGANIVSFNDPGKIVRNAIAVTIVGWYDDGQSETLNGIDFGRYLETDMSFSKRLTFTTAALGSCSGSYDIEAVATHEAGHALGLGHSASGAALMFASVSACEFKRIHQDDSDGINTIYTPGFGGGTPCTPSEARLAGHSCSSPSNGPNCLVVTITVTDDCGNGVSGAPVTVQLDGQEAGDLLTGTASTDGSGSVSFGLRCRDASSTTYISTVTAIGGSLPWSAGDPDNTADVTTTCVITR